MSGRSDDTPRRPRIFMLAYQISPHDARYLKLRASFLAAGFEVAAAAPGFPGRPVHASVRPVETGERPGGKLAAWLQARRIQVGLAKRGVDFAPDVIYAFDPEALPAAVRLKRLTGARLIYDAHEFHEDEDPSAPARGAWVRRTELATTPQLDSFVTINTSIAALYAGERPGLPIPLVVRNALDPAPLAADDGRLRAAAKAEPNSLLLLYQGGMAHLRGLDRLVAAAPLLAPRWRLVMMGGGPLLAQLQSAADPKRVCFLAAAPHAELTAWTRGADLGAILYEDSGRNQHFCSPNKLWEYPAAGVATLASDLPEIARVVRGHGTGFLAPQNAAPEEIAHTVNALTDDARAAAARRGLAFVANETWADEVAPLIELIGVLAKDRRGS